MASGVISMGQSGHLLGQIVWSSTSNGSIANSSTVTIDIQVRRDNSYTTTGDWGAWGYIDPYDPGSWSRHTSVSDGWVSLGGFSYTVGHNSDGTKQLIISGAAEGPSGTSLSGVKVEASAVVTLDTIPRASSIDSFTTSTNYLNSILTVKYTPKATFYHKLVISISGNTVIKTVALGQKTATQQTTTYQFTSTELNTIYNAIGGNNDNTNVSCVIQTYSDSNYTNKIGDSSALTKKLYMPESIIPTISNITIAEAVSGIAAKFGAYIQNQSKLSVNITAAGVQGSTIKSYSASINSQTFTTSSFTTGFLISSGTNTLTVKVTDSRNRTATTTRQITVLAYSKPSISSFTAARNESTPTTINCKFTASITPLNNLNDKTFKIKLDNTDKQTYTDAYTKTNQTYDITGTSDTSTYVAKLIVADYFNTVEVDVPINTDFKIMHFTEDGKHIAFGQYYDTNNPALIQVNGNIDATGGFIKEKHYQITPIDITGTTNTLLSRIKALGTNGIMEATWLSKTDGGTSGISDKPTGTTNAGFVCNAICNRWASNSDYRYIVNCYVQGENSYYNAVVTNASTSISWSRPIARVTMSSKTHSNYNNYQNYLATMSCLTYWNGAYNSSNSSNLTYAHQGTIQCKPTNLYNNTSGNNGTITLSQTCANFTYLEILAKHNSGNAGYYTIRVYSPNNKIVDISDNTTDVDNWIVLHSAHVKFSGTSMTRVRSAALAMNITNQDLWNGGYSTAHEINIYRIDGYK